MGKEWEIYDIYIQNLQDALGIIHLTTRTQNVPKN